MQIKKMALADLVPADYNPRSISDAAFGGLQKSIERFGLVQPIIYNNRTGCVVGGHQRLRALLEAGQTHTQVVIVDLPEAEEKALNLTLNNQAIAGEFTADVALILAELEELLPEACVDLRLDKLDFDLPATDVAAEYEGMPEFANENLGAYRQIIVSFRNDQDAQVFAALIGQEITAKTRSMWFPPEEPEKVGHLRYVEEQ